MGSLPGHLPREFSSTIQKQSFCPGKLTTTWWIHFTLLGRYPQRGESQTRRTRIKYPKTSSFNDVVPTASLPGISWQVLSLRYSLHTGRSLESQSMHTHCWRWHSLLSLTPQFSSLIKCIRTDSCGSIFLLAMMSLRVCKLLPSTPRHPLHWQTGLPGSWFSQFEVDETSSLWGLIAPLNTSRGPQPEMAPRLSFQCFPQLFIEPSRKCKQDTASHSWEPLTLACLPDTHWVA